MKIALIALTGIVTLAQASRGQGTPFQNLDFELANPVSAGQPFTVTASSALPDWTVYCGTVEQTTVFQNVTSTGQATADIFGPTSPSPGALPNGAPGIMDGHFTVALQGGYEPSLNAIVDTSLQQTGLIPVGTESLMFKAWQTGATTLSVSIDGNNLPLINLGTTANYTLWGADVSAYAGQSGLLDFTAGQQNSSLSFLELDDIAFSATSVPEPSPLILTGVGGALFALYRRFVAKR